MRKIYDLRSESSLKPGAQDVPVGDGATRSLRQTAVRAFGWLGAATLGLTALTACPEPMPQENLNQPGQGVVPSDPLGAPAVQPPGEAGQPQPPGQEQAATANQPGSGSGPALRINEVFPNTLTQEAVEKAGNYITIKGSISGSGCDGKTMRIDAVEQGELVNKLVTFLKTDKLGEFKLMVPKGDKKYYILGACDVNGDGTVDATNDMMSAYPKNPLTGSADMAGVEMKMVKPPVTEGVLPEPAASRKPPQTANPANPPAGQGPGAAGAAPGAAPAGDGKAPADGKGAAAPGGAPAGAPAAANPNPAANPTSGNIPGVLKPTTPAAAPAGTDAAKPATAMPPINNLPGVLAPGARPASGK